MSVWNNELFSNYFLKKIPYSGVTRIRKDVYEEFENILNVITFHLLYFLFQPKEKYDRCLLIDRDVQET